MGFLVSAVALWVLAYGVVKIADVRSSGRVSEVLNSRNVVMHPGAIQVTTTALNSWLENLGKRHRKLLSHWFLLGVLIGFLGFFASLFILSSHILAAILPTSLVGVPRLPGALANFNAAARHVDLPPSVAKFAERSRRWTARGKDKFIKFRKWRRARKTKKRSTFRGYHDRAQQQRLSSEAAAAAVTEHTQNSANRDPVSVPMPPQLGDQRDPDEIHPVARFTTSYLNSRNVNVVARPVMQQSSGSRQHLSDEMMHVEQLQLRPVARVVAPHAHQFTEVQSDPVDLVAARHPPASTYRISSRGPTGDDTSSTGVHHDSAASRQVPEPQVDTDRPARAMLTLLLPGVTIPASDVVYLAVALLVAMGVHELGHALAAATYDAHVASVGGFLAFVFPGAYVQLEGVEKLATLPQLKVYCAGVWHNIVTALLALLLAAALPSLSVVFFAPRAGALVVDVPKQSPLTNHLEPGDVITRFGPFSVHDGGRSFRGAVAQLVKSNYTAGFCVSGQLYSELVTPGLRCCDQTLADVDSTQQCFIVAGAPRRLAKTRRACLSTRAVSRQPVCHKSSQCLRDETRRLGRTVRAAVPEPPGSQSADSGEESAAPERPKCFLAVLPGNARLVDVHIHSVRTGADHRLIYEGFPQVLAHAATVSSYVPRMWSVLPYSLIVLLARLDVPNHLHRLLTYFASLSLAIALLNLVPVRRLDGEHIVPLFLQLVYPKLSIAARDRARTVCVRIGTCLLALNVGISYAQYGFS